MSIMNKVQCNHSDMCELENCVHRDLHRIIFDYYCGIEFVPGEASPCSIEMECQLNGNRVLCILVLV